MPDRTIPTPPPELTHISVDCVQSVLRIKLSPLRPGRVIWGFLIIVVPSILACLAIIANKGLSGSPATLLPFFAFLGLFLWARIGFEALTIDGHKLSLYKGATTISFDLNRIHGIRYERAAHRFGNSSIRLEHAAQVFRFGRDLTEPEARWVIDLLQSFIGRPPGDIS